MDPLIDDTFQIILFVLFAVSGGGVERTKTIFGMDTCAVFGFIQR